MKICNSKPSEEVLAYIKEDVNANYEAVCRHLPSRGEFIEDHETVGEYAITDLRDKTDDEFNSLLDNVIRVHKRTFVNFTLIAGFSFESDDSDSLRCKK
jgi:hypothetical protein